MEGKGKEEDEGPSYQVLYEGVRDAMIRVLGLHLTHAQIAIWKQQPLELIAALVAERGKVYEKELQSEDFRELECIIPMMPFAQEIDDIAQKLTVEQKDELARQVHFLYRLSVEFLS